MYIIREILHCKPGKVRPMVEKFKVLSSAVQDMGHPPIRLLTDVSGESFWTVIAEISVDKIDDFFAVEEKVIANAAVRAEMADYHDLVERGAREIYRVEA